MKALIRTIFLNEKYNYIYANAIFILISLVISWLLTKSKDISVTGGIILTIFQVFIMNTFWLAVEIKFKLDDIGKTKSTNDEIIKQFAESELLQKGYVTSLIKDLNFDKNVKKNFPHIKEAHFYISKLKIETYFNEFFVFNPEQNMISDVPSAYFESKIWPKLVTDSPFYYSVQILKDKQWNYYIENAERRRTEINTIANRTDLKKESFCKLFVIDDDFIEDNKIKKDSGTSNCKYKKMYIYLKAWHEGVGKKMGYNLKVARASLSIGHQDEDIGIFGDFYGIQRIRNNDEKKIMREELKIDFYFNVNDARERAEKFKKFFDSNENFLLADEIFR